MVTKSTNNLSTSLKAWDISFLFPREEKILLQRLFVACSMVVSHSTLLQFLPRCCVLESLHNHIQDLPG